MDTKNVIAAFLALCTAAYGQTRALYINTNNEVIPGVNVTFNGAINFVTNTQADTTRSNLSLGLPALTNTTGAGLLSALGGLATNGDAAGLTNFPSNLMTTNGDASGLTNFPPSLLTTNGDGSGLTNLPNANLTNATGILPIANGGTGQTNAGAAIEALLPAYTNNEGKVLGLDTNLALVWTTNAGGGGSGSVTNVDASGGSTGLSFSGGPITNGGTLTLGGTLNLASGGTGGTNAGEARTALQLGTAATNDATAFQPASTNLNTLASNNAINLTNFPAGLATYPSLSNNAGLVLAVTTNETGVEWIAVSNTVTDASTLTNFPTLNQNTTGTAANVTGVVAITNGGTGTNSAVGARVTLLPSYTGNSNKVLAVNAGETDVEWVTQSGGGGGTVDLSTTNATGILPTDKGGTGGTNGVTALVNLGIYNGNASSIQIGDGADAKISGAWNTAIGKGAVTETFTSQTRGLAVGYAGKVWSSRSSAFGEQAEARANDAIQLGNGVNSNATTIQFRSGGSVNETKWGYLANASAAGGYAMTNTNVITTNISVVGTNNTNTLVFSNGILTSVTSP